MLCGQVYVNWNPGSVLPGFCVVWRGIPAKGSLLSEQHAVESFPVRSMRRHMRKNITSVILFAFILCALGGILSRCGRDGDAPGNGAAVEDAEVEGNGGTEADKMPEEGGESTEGVDLQAGSETGRRDAEDGGAETSKTKGGPEEAEKNDLALQEKLRPSVLQIYCGDYRGSGVVWEITEEEVTVISSGHLLKNAETCDILCYAGVYYEAKVDRVLENCDIGFAVFPTQALQEDGVELTAAVPSMRKPEKLVQGEELVVYGSMDVVAGDFVKGYLIEAETEMELQGNDGPQLLMLGGIVREGAEGSGYDGVERETVGREKGGANPESRGEEDHGNAEEPGSDETQDSPEQEKDSPSERSAVDAGMSGSGVFDRKGELLGILAGGDGERGFAAVPVWRIGE